MTAPSLIERLEGAERGCPDFDADIIEAFGFQTIRGRRHSKGVNWRYRGVGEWGYESHWSSIPNFSQSLDAALALAERVLPGTFWQVQHTSVVSGERMYFAEVYPEDSDNPEGWEGFAKTPALALSIAILRARKDTL